LNILFLTLKTFSATGGIEKFNRCFCRALDELANEKGWEIKVLSAYDNQPVEKYIRKPAFIGFGGNRAGFFIAAVAAMRKADIIIYSHINLAPLMWLGRSIFPRKKSICLAHGREVWQRMTRVQQVELAACNSVWSVSRFTANILSTQKGINPYRIFIFPNCLDPFFAKAEPTVDPASLRKRFGILPTDKVILSLARLADTEKFKGYDEVLRILPSLSRRMEGIKYVLAGKWDENEKKRITKLINALKLHNLVILTGFIEDFELGALYRSADAFILPSRKEGFGIVFLEAAWCGLPVTGGNRDGSTEALLDGQLGTLVDPESRVEIEEALYSALSNPLNPEQKEEQRRLVNAHFGYEQFKKRLSCGLEQL
jgi:glycosyltransferase involved in cell wall biosynthesis